MSDPQTLNLYGYVRNNPLSGADLNGHGWWKDLWHGIVNSTYKPLATLVQHPILSARAIGFSVAHPLQTIRGIKSSVTVTVTGVAHGNGEAIGVTLGTVGMFFIPGGEAGDAAKAVEEAAEAGKVIGAAEGAIDAVKALKSDLQMQEIMSGSAIPIAGAGTGTKLVDAARLAAQYGGEEGDWVKIVSSHATPAGGEGGFGKAGYNGGYEIHAYKNVKTGQIVEPKTKF